MFPYLDILGRQLPSYGVLGVAGVILGLLLSMLCCKQHGLDRDDCAYIYVFGAVGAVLGAKLLYFLTVLPQLAQDLPLLWEDPVQFAAKYGAGGLVFYGGLLGGIGGAALFARFISVRLRDFFPVFIPVFPLVHAIGRVGCFAVGCCYGREASWGIAYTHSEIAPNGVKLIPTQLIEAAAEVLICLLLLWYARRNRPPMRLLALYFMTYAPVRFILEFFRGDAARGVILGLSTSQWISLLIFGVGIVLWLRPKRRTELCVR